MCGAVTFACEGCKVVARQAQVLALPQQQVNEQPPCVPCRRFALPPIITPSQMLWIALPLKVKSSNWLCPSQGIPAGEPRTSDTLNLFPPSMDAWKRMNNNRRSHLDSIIGAHSFNTTHPFHLLISLVSCRVGVSRQTSLPKSAACALSCRRLCFVECRWPLIWLMEALKLERRVRVALSVSS
jgi:hypothetical protein